MKKVDKWLFSTVGIIAVLVIILAANLLGNLFKVRADLTANKLYTLSDGTRKILGKLDTDVVLRFYYSKSDASAPIQLRTYAQQIQDLLDEYKQVSHGKIKVQLLDPVPDSDAEDSANLDGVDGQTTQDGDKVYLGLAVSCLDTKTAIPFLSPQRAPLLEYDISRAISNVINPKKTVVGVMSALPVMGQQSSPMMMQQQQSMPPWVFIQELQQNYQLKPIPLTADKIDPGVSLLLIVYPKGITPQTQFAIDQFILKGGKVVALLDPLSFIDLQLSKQNQMMGGDPNHSATLDKLLPAWGLTFTDQQVVAANAFGSQTQRSSTPDPTVLTVTDKGLNKKDPLLAVSDNLLLPFAGAFTGRPAPGLHEDILIHTIGKTGLIDPMTAQMGAQAVDKQLKYSDTEYPIAIRLTGTFKTAFPSGNPAASTDKVQKPGNNLKTGDGKGAVILVGDSDFVFDQIAGQVQDVLGQSVFSPANGNLNFVEGAVEQFSGDSNLIEMRSRASVSRPLTVINDINNEAAQKYQSKMNDLQNKLDATRQKLAELQNGKQSDQKTILSSAQQAEIKQFQKDEATTNHDLKEMRKDLRQEIDSLETFLKWINIAAMPLLVTLIGLVLALVKRRKLAAR
jgi:ABC-type uncharacterized transport system involved in gliding motility auxiliary subunit